MSAGGVAVLEYVTLTVAGQLFGLPIRRVQDVFILERLTRVPLAGPCIVGVLNLRGRIVTAIDLRARLGLPSREIGPSSLAIGIECDGEVCGLTVDAVGEVMALDALSRGPVPANLDPRWREVAQCVHRLDSGFLVVLDVERVLNLETDRAAA